MRKGFKQLVSEANAAVETVLVDKAMEALKTNEAVFVDVRDLPELQRDGRIPGSVHASRGMLEFYADPDSPYYNKIFASGKRLILYCASGGRSALATQRLQEMGVDGVAHIGGGLKAWKEANGPLEPVR